MEPSEHPKGKPTKREKIAKVVPGIIEPESTEANIDFLGMLSNTNLSFETDPVSGDLCIGLIGASVLSRSQLQVELTYGNGEKEILDGKDIMMGGTWNIPYKKAKSIRGVNLMVRNKEEA